MRASGGGTVTHFTVHFGPKIVSLLWRLEAKDILFFACHMADAVSTSKMINASVSP